MKLGDVQKKAKESEASRKKRTPAISALRRVTWAELKNRIKGNDVLYAIEALVGDVKYYYQGKTQQWQGKPLASDGVSLPNETARAAMTQPNRSPRDFKNRVDRIHVNSVPVLMILAEILDLELSEEPSVHLYPFKALARHNEDIRAYLKMLESNWVSSEEETTTDQKSNKLFTGEKELEPNAASNDPSLVEVSTMGTESKGQTGSHEGSVPSSENVASSESKVLIDSAEAMKDLRCLVQFMDKELEDPDRYRKPNPPLRISFKDLWFLFKPGDQVYSPIQAQSE